jgi:D-glycero-D-manno-heptose 1,7-bisphosphate phosphatase
MSAADQRSAIFLDRDGTLNMPVVREGKPHPPDKIADFRLMDGAAAACKALHAVGFVLVVVTNQPDVGRGTLSQSEVEAMHALLLRLIPQISRIEVCYAPGQGKEHPDNRRRKPEPGMIIDAAEALGLDLNHSWMIGDRWVDVDCGRRAGVRTVFIDLGYSEKLQQMPDHVVGSLSAAAAIVLAQGRP